MADDMSDVVLDGDEAAALGGYTEDAWRLVSGEVATGPVSELEAPPTPAVPGRAGVSLDAVKASLDEEGPQVLAWRLADAGAIAGQWADLRAFVEWVVEVYVLETSEHRACWWRHPGIVQEWLGLWHLHRLGWSPSDSGAGPNTFHYLFAQARMRLPAAWSKTSCTPREHVTPRRPMDQYTTITDAEWVELTGDETGYVPPVQWPSWRSAGGEVE